MSRLDHTLDPNDEAVRRIEVITGGWSASDGCRMIEKAEAVDESLRPGVVISQVPRRRGLTPQQLFTWRRAARQNAGFDAVSFASVVVEQRGSASAGATLEIRSAVVQPHVIKLDIDGASVWIWRDADVEMVTAIILEGPVMIGPTGARSCNGGDETC